MHPSAPFLFLLVAILSMLAFDFHRGKRPGLAAVFGGLTIAGFLVLALLSVNDTDPHHQPEPKEATQ